MSDKKTPVFHEDAQGFRDALNRTASGTGFSERLIEKDYFCSVLLKGLQLLFGHGLVFKGGTCLSKVHAEFFRLSEDLDFGISLKPEASRGERRQAASPVKEHLAAMLARLPIFSEVAALTGQNSNRQYNGKIAYRSLVTGEQEYIKIELSLREEVLLPAEELEARTMLINPLTNAAAVTPIVVRALSLREAYAEKFRAALTRRDPAIRDFFDIDNAIQKGLLNPFEPEFLSLLCRKLALTTDQVEMSLERTEALTRQVETHLKPVLRTADYEKFVLQRVFEVLTNVLSKAGRSEHKPA